MKVVEKILTIILIFIVQAFIMMGLLFLYYQRQVTNVFDEIYYSNYYGYFFENLRTETRMINVDKISFWSEGGISSLGDGADHSASYLDEYTNENERIILEFIGEGESLILGGSSKNMVISYLIYHDPMDDTLAETDSFQIYMSYDVDTKELEYENIGVRAKGEINTENMVLVVEFLNEHGYTRSKIGELQEYVLYEKILTDWFYYNADTTRFSMERLGKFTLVNNTFEQLDAYGWDDGE